MKGYIFFLVCFLLISSALFLEDARANKPELSSERWESDIRIGDKDSVSTVVFDVSSAGGTLFAAFKNTENGTDYWTVSISTDLGETWMETGFMGPGIGDIDAAFFKTYFYLVYSIGNKVLIRRFHASNGSWDLTYGTDTVTSSGSNIREIAFASTQDFSPQTRVYCFVLRDDNSLEYHYSSEDVETWSTLGVVSVNADRGLDACCNEGYSSEYVWCSYIGTNDSVYIGSVGSDWNSYGPLTDVAWSISGFSSTSIGAYRDIVMVLYPYVFSEFGCAVKSCVSYNGGDSWEYEGTVFNSSLTMGAGDITARREAGFGVVINDYNFGLYTHRDYAPGEWSDTVHFTNPGMTAYRIKPSIENISTECYGMVYVDYPTMGAWFDISDRPPPGIEENAPRGEEVFILNATPSVFSGRTSIEYILPTQQNISLDVYDVLGNHVINLVSGDVPAGNHSTSWDGKDALSNAVPNGMYFCVLKVNGKENTNTKITLIK